MRPSSFEEPMVVGPVSAEGCRDSRSQRRRASAFSSWARSFVASRSSSVNPLDAVPITALLLADFCVPFFAGVPLSHCPRQKLCLERGVDRGTISDRGCYDLAHRSQPIYLSSRCLALRVPPG
jgi:hypothetical protein